MTVTEQEQKFVRLNPDHPRTKKLLAIQALEPVVVSASSPPPARAPLPVLRPCIAQGPAVERAACACPRKHKYTCLKTGKTVTPAQDCTADCTHGYEPDDATEPFDNL